jgi:hypothetical protein
MATMLNLALCRLNKPSNFAIPPAGFTSNAKYLKGVVANFSIVIEILVASILHDLWQVRVVHCDLQGLDDMQ